MIVYEWDVEIVDRESRDIIDHHFVGSLKEGLGVVERYKGSEDDRDYEIVLARDEEIGEGVDRLWAYLLPDGTLPEFFSDAGGSPRKKVPKKFHDECKKVA
jgi:hypothetical protein